MPGITHTKISIIEDGDNTDLVRPSDWNAEHGIESLVADSAIWWHEYNISPSAVSKGSHGATFVEPDANTIGGWQLDNSPSEEHLYFWSHVEHDWDGISDVQLHVMFEVNVDNTGGADGDTVDLQLVCRIKGDGESAMKTQTIEFVTVVGKSARYKQFEAHIMIDYDDESNPIHAEDIIGFILNLKSATSEVTDIVVNYMEFKYKTAYPAPEF